MVGPSPSIDVAASSGHQFALVAAGRCRACAELLPGGAIWQGEGCAHCQTPACFDEHERGRVFDHLDRQMRFQVGTLALAVGASHLVVGWFPLLGSLVLAAASVWIRLRIIRSTARLLSRPRRRVTLWTGRLLTAVTVAGMLVVHELLTLLPVLGAMIKGVLAALQILALAAIHARYIRWQIARDRQRLPVALWERLLLGAFVGAFAAASMAVAMVFGVVLAGLSTLAAWMVR